MTSSRWPYHGDETDTNDGSYCASEADMEALATSSAAASVDCLAMGEWGDWGNWNDWGEQSQWAMLSSSPMDTNGTANNLAAGSLSTQPPQMPRRAVPETEPMKVQLPADARALPTLLDPRVPAKKMPKFATEFGESASLNPSLPAKKRLPENLLEAGSRKPEAR
eukprot:CAMPEP_0197657844 /NCGR_PEP_ID=MMETSP1338-20131121/44878_1 /TAXON_ID=43686 ORGANISM="Pelagodinium beii, Strain RCC1491" /NCGR_SAMPLE_ID=MMETSP1338 /ASSEMBLY_ACC=CAM_ASM_000754 /LENGTH=164 /DNA_ID=CAMNT_0043234305 /DNA_START=117 /DNA_END=611 /DNA_ORIENTATION=+